MECAPTARVLVLNVALPALSSVPVPSVAAASLKVTIPEGVPAPGATALTVAVKVIAVPNRIGLVEDADELSAVDVSAFFTVWDRAAEVLALKLPSPP